MFDIFNITVGDVIKQAEKLVNHETSYEEFKDFLEAFNIKNGQGFSHVWDFDGIMSIFMLNAMNHYRNEPGMKNMSLNVEPDALKNKDMNYYRFMVNYLYYKDSNY